MDYRFSFFPPRVFPVHFIDRNQVDDATFRFLLTGGVALDNLYPNPAPDWLADRAWSEIVRCSSLPDLGDYMNRKFTSNHNFKYFLSGYMR